MNKAAVVAISFFTLTFCISLQTSSGEACATESEDKANGWWILHEYHDRIMNNRCIGEFSFEHPVWSSILINVTADSVFSYGSIFPCRVSPILEGDTITIINGMHTTLPLMYSTKKNELLITFTDGNRMIQTFHYRRMRSSELVALTKSLEDSSQYWQLDKNYQDFFQQQFFTGTFTDLNGNSFTINKKGKVNGFDKWNSCLVDNFFGTTHWTGKRDRVRFENSTGAISFQDYNWRYRGDTLILKKFVGPDIEQYKIGKEEVRYIRSPLAH